MKRTLAGLIAGSVLAGWGSGVPAQDAYPSRPMQLVAPAVGVSTDVIGRLIADGFQRRTGQTMVVVNRPGAAGTIAAQAVATAAPDGYTLLVVNAAHVMNTFLYPKLSFDNFRDFVGVALLAEAPFVVVVGAQLGIKTLQEFIARAKQAPGTINYASAGFGSTTHIAGSLFASKAGIDIVHVPYQNMANILVYFLGGRIHSGFYPPGFMLQPIREGNSLRLRCRPKKACAIRLCCQPRGKRRASTMRSPVGTAFLRPPRPRPQSSNGWHARSSKLPRKRRSRKNLSRSGRHRAWCCSAISMRLSRRSTSGLAPS